MYSYTADCLLYWTPDKKVGYWFDTLVADSSGHWDWELLIATKKWRLPIHWRSRTLVRKLTKPTLDSPRYGKTLRQLFTLAKIITNFSSHFIACNVILAWRAVCSWWKLLVWESNLPKLAKILELIYSVLDLKRKSRFKCVSHDWIRAGVLSSRKLDNTG